MHRVLFYGLIFAGVVGVSGAGAYLLAPARTIAAPAKQQNNEKLDEGTDDLGEEDIDVFIPVELTPKDYFINNLTMMKSLKGEANINIATESFSIDLNNVALDIDLTDLTDIKLACGADLVYNNESTHIDVTYLDGVIYASLLGNDLKVESSDISALTNMVSSLGIPLELPDLGNISIDALMEILGNMTYESNLEGYKYTIELFEGCAIDFYSDADYKMTAISANKLEIAGISLSLDATTTTSVESEVVVVSPETETKEFAKFSNFFPAIESISELVKQRQFGIELSGRLLSKNETVGTSFNGVMDFDVEKLIGNGNITIIQNEAEFTPTHNVAIDVDNELMRFCYNENLHGKFYLSSLNGLIDMFKDLIRNNDPRFYQWFGSFIENMQSTTIVQIINGHFELLFNDYVKTLEADENSLHIIVDKKLFELDSDLDLTLTFTDKKVASLTIDGLSIFGMSIDLDVNLIDYQIDRTILPALEEATYYDFSDIQVLLALGITTADLDHYHLTGDIDLPINVLGFNIKNLIKDVKLDLHVFDDNGAIKISGVLDKIPTKISINSISSELSLPLTSGHDKTVEFYYDAGFIYMTKHDWDRKTALSKHTEVITSIKVSADDFVENIMDYILRFALGLNDTIMKTINDSLSKTSVRDSALDISKILTQFAYDKAGNEHHWQIALDMAELANNPDLDYLKVNVYGGPITIAGVTKDYLSHLDADLFINTGSVFSLHLLLSAKLVDIDPSLSSDRFTELSAYNSMNSYLVAHQNDAATY